MMRDTQRQIGEKQIATDIERGSERDRDRQGETEGGSERARERERTEGGAHTLKVLTSTHAISHTTIQPHHTLPDSENRSHTILQTESCKPDS